ncbi:MAG: hypothetical protein EBT32_12125 [Betaproteobacteria bacterium]|nr:hypothetical protein [Betaproteobacteria bacterium]
MRLKAVLGNEGVIELGCLAHARRKFFDLHQAAGGPELALIFETDR